MTQGYRLVSRLFVLAALCACSQGDPVSIDAGSSDASFGQPIRAQAGRDAGRQRVRDAGLQRVRDAGLQRMAASGAAADTTHDPPDEDNEAPAPAPAPALDAATPPSDAAADDDDSGAPGPGEASAQRELTWVLDTIAQGKLPSTAELTQHFAPELLGILPPDELMQAFMQLQSLRPVHVTRSVVSSPVVVQVQLATAMGPYLLTLQVEAAAPHRISELLFNKIPGSYEEAEAQLQALASDTQFYVAELSNAACQAIEVHGGAEPLAIGSAFKLWVLLALDRKLASDARLDWASPLSVRDELKSLPSGTFQDEPAGTVFSLRDFARAMISVSDNTATDHLIDLVGRTTVEREQSETGHSAPDLNTPWLYTREFFALKLWATPEQLAAIRGAALEDKRVLLEQLRSEPLDLSDAAQWTSPRRLEFEWFANGDDVCNALATVAQRGELDPQSELLQMLAANPGVPFDPAVWPYIGFKGGSEVGVLNLSFLLRRADGRWFSIVMTLNDATHDIDIGGSVAVAHGLAQLLGAAE